MDPPASPPVAAAPSGSPGSPGSPGRPLHIALAGTHPNQFNGYSKVVYEMGRQMGAREDVQLDIFGFQNFYSKPGHDRALPPKVSVYDASANEVPKKNGFGVEQLEAYVRSVKPDVFVVFNDMVIVYQCIEKLAAVRRELGFRLVVYLDQVYLHQKRAFIEMLNLHADLVVCFTEGWAQCVTAQGMRRPTGFVQHGFDRRTFFPIARNVARRFFGMGDGDFIVLNLNRNQPRKRWDLCIKAWAEFVSRHRGEPVRLVVGTAMQEAWNLMEIYERELIKRGMTLVEGQRHVLGLGSPQTLTDAQINILMNCADVGINTADGEGFGLCTFEHAGVGVAQVAPRIGGFVDYLDDDSALLCDPVMNYYVDNSRDMVGGEAQLCDYMDFVEALESYYADPDLRARHGAALRARIAEPGGRYDWALLADRMVSLCRQAVDQPAMDAPVPPAAPQTAAPQTAAPASPSPAPASLDAPAPASPDAPAPASPDAPAPASPDAPDAPAPASPDAPAPAAESDAESAVAAGGKRSRKSKKGGGGGGGGGGGSVATGEGTKEAQEAEEAKEAKEAKGGKGGKGGKGAKAAQAPAKPQAEATVAPVQAAAPAIAVDPAAVTGKGKAKAKGKAKGKVADDTSATATAVPAEAPVTESLAAMAARLEQLQAQLNAALAASAASAAIAANTP